MVILSARIDCEIFDIDVRLLVIFKGVLNALVEFLEEMAVFVVVVGQTSLKLRNYIKIKKL